MDSTGSIQLPKNFTSQPRADAPPPKPTEGEENGAPSLNQTDIVKLTQALTSTGSNMRAGEKITYSFEDNKVIVTKEGPSRLDELKAYWDVAKTAVSDTGNAVGRVVRVSAEQDPTFVLREALEVARGSVDRISPGEEVTKLVGHGVYPVMRCVFTAVDVAKALKTQKDPLANKVDKYVDYGHVATDVAGILAIAPDAAKLFGLSRVASMIAIPGAQYFAAAAIIGDYLAGAYHAVRLASQGSARMKAIIQQDQQQHGQGVKPPATVPKPEEDGAAKKA